MRLADDPPHRLPAIIVTPDDPPRGIGHNGGPPLEDPPEIPRSRPTTGKKRTKWKTIIFEWFGQAIKAGQHVAQKVFAAAKLVLWLVEHIPQIITHLDRPKSREELQRAVATPRAGTDVDHSAEARAMEKEGYPFAEINAPENLARIPTLKHYLITGWYPKLNKKYGGLTPRQYLVGKPLSERRRVKREAMIHYGVLQP